MSFFDTIISWFPFCYSSEKDQEEDQKFIDLFHKEFRFYPIKISKNGYGNFLITYKSDSSFSFERKLLTIKRNGMKSQDFADSCFDRIHFLIEKESRPYSVA